MPAGRKMVRQLMHVNGMEADELTLAEVGGSPLALLVEGVPRREGRPAFVPRPALPRSFFFLSLYVSEMQGERISVQV